ncbi:MAG TPA: DUF1043 family protein [Gammaproteobacteria bacterium]|nr:DUF1043 family protein [Gammaproteobacteria bacterium]
MNGVLTGVIGLLAGFIAGFLAGRASRAKDARRSTEFESELQNARQEAEEYRNRVNQHFEKTAELVGDLTNSYRDMTRRYRKVYEHLAQGAHTLASTDTGRMITSSTIERLIYEANEDTHVAEKSIPEQPGTKAKASRPERSEVPQPGTGKQHGKRKPASEKTEEKTPDKEKPAAATGTGQQDKKPKQAETGNPISSKVEQKQSTEGKKGTGKS